MERSSSNMDSLQGLFEAVFGDPNLIRKEKRFILEIVRDLGSFDSTLAHHNEQLLWVVEDHLALSGRQRRSLVKLIQENGKTIEKGLKLLIDTARCDILGFRPTAVAHYTEVKRNFDKLDKELTAAESKTSFSTKERFVVLMYRLKRIGDWHVSRYLFHSSPKHRIIYRHLFAVSTVQGNEARASAEVETAHLNQLPDDDNEALECMICHEAAESDPFVHVLEAIKEQHKEGTRTRKVTAVEDAISPGDSDSESAEGHADAQEQDFDSGEEYDDDYDEEGFDSDENEFEEEGFDSDEEHDREYDEEGVGQSDGEKWNEQVVEEESPAAKNEKTENGVASEELPGAKDVVSEVGDKSATGPAARVPGHGLTPCCKKPYHPFCLIPWTDRSETCPMCHANWAISLDFQIEMHELRIRQIQQQLDEWDAEDLQVDTGSVE